MRTVPEGYHSVNSFLIVEEAEKLVQFLKQTFDAKVEELVKGPDGRVAHAELTVGDSVMMMADATPKYGATVVHLYVYLENVDLTFKRALEAGATRFKSPLTSSMEIERPVSRTRPETIGGSPSTWKMCRGKNWDDA